jgi:hypothetical protein
MYFINASRQLQVIILLFVFCLHVISGAKGDKGTAKPSAGTFFHQSSEQHKLSPGWQEPGLWRPKWRMDRIHYDEEGEESGRDTLHFRMKMDRTIHIYTQNRRPILEIMKPNYEKPRKERPIFESKKESDLATQRKDASQKLEGFFDVDGTWWWQDGAPLNFARVKLETRELDEDGEEERVRHEVLTDWGNLDGYAFNFRQGKILRDKKKKDGALSKVPTGQYLAGVFQVKVSPHRPLVDKTFTAFQ